MHNAITSETNEIFSDYNLDWKYILNQIFKGIEELHNDIKSDNIVFTPCFSSNRQLSLTLAKLAHHRVAPDLCNGLCAQCQASDIFSFGRIMYMISTFRKDQSLVNNVCCITSELRASIVDLKHSLKL